MKNGCFEARDYVSPSTKNRRLIHIVERHSPETSRVQHAVKSWKVLYDRFIMVPVHIWHSARSSRNLGDLRDLPYLKDLLKQGLDRSSESDIIVFTNGDIVIHPEISDILLKYMDSYGAVCSFRVNVKNSPPLIGTPQWWATLGPPDFGRDLFAFRASWLTDHWDSIPNFFVGEWEWDLVMALLIRMSNGVPISGKEDLRNLYEASEIPLGYVMHEMHERKWLHKAFFDSPAKRHNLGLANSWYVEHGLESFQIII